MSVIRVIPFHSLLWIYTITISKVSQPKNQSVPRYTYLISTSSTSYRDLAIVRKHVPYCYILQTIYINVLRIPAVFHLTISIFLFPYILYIHSAPESDRGSRVSISLPHIFHSLSINSIIPMGQHHHAHGHAHEPPVVSHGRGGTSPLHIQYIN